jgi:predicted RNA polymerase sigma factor
MIFLPGGVISDLGRLGRGDQMREAYERALIFADNEQVRRFIEHRLRSQ